MADGFGLEKANGGVSPVFHCFPVSRVVAMKAQYYTLNVHYATAWWRWLRNGAVCGGVSHCLRGAPQGPTSRPPRVLPRQAFSLRQPTGLPQFPRHNTTVMITTTITTLLPLLCESDHVSRALSVLGRVVLHLNDRHHVGPRRGRQFVVDGRGRPYQDAPCTHTRKRRTISQQQREREENGENGYEPRVNPSWPATTPS